MALKIKRVIMSGIVKRKYNKETGLYMKSFTYPLNSISKILPYEYNRVTILNIFKEFYPRQWNELVSRYQYYTDKDKNLQKNGKRTRFHHKKPENFLFGLAKTEQIMSHRFIEEHKKRFNELVREQEYNKFKEDRKIKNDIYHKNIAENNKLAQNLEPLYIDLFISEYHRKGVTIQEKLEIVNEIKKFNCNKSIKFLQKLNDSERNNQVRREAFNHLQKSGVYVKLRKNFKGKQKEYHIERDQFIVTPSDLIKRLNSNSIQSKKSFDVFISHSFHDNDKALILKDSLNSHKLSVYLDWTSDNDFLRREVASNYTKLVLMERIKQSKIVIFLRSEKCINTNLEISSPWIEMELSFAKKINKRILCINLLGGDSLFEEVSFTLSNDNFRIHKESIEDIYSNINKSF
ncbi:TPA: toll/interleukin-1 receptor domain-containing protein [Photobacterium damselae]